MAAAQLAVARLRTSAPLMFRAVASIYAPSSTRAPVPSRLQLGLCSFYAIKNNYLRTRDKHAACLATSPATKAGGWSPPAPPPWPGKATASVVMTRSTADDSRKRQMRASSRMTTGGVDAALPASLLVLQPNF